MRFLTAFCVTAVMLAATAACFFASSAIMKKETAQAPTTGSVPDERVRGSILMVYDDGEKVFACILSLSGGVSAKRIGADALPYRLSDIYRRDGIFALADETGCPGFVKFTPETFVKFADISGGVVYNDNGTRRLITAGRAAEGMNGTLFAGFCADAVGAFYPGRAEAFLAAVADECEYDLSYPELCGIFGRED